MNKRFIIHILAIFWGCILALQFLIYNSVLREKLFGINSVLEMTVSSMNDLIWIPLALALPLYISRLAKRRFHHIKKCYLLPLALFIILLGLMNLPLYFKFLFILLLVYVLLFFITAIRFVAINYSYVLFTFCIVYLLLHYGGQLFPQLIPDHSEKQIKLMTYNVKVDQQPDEHARIIDFIEKEKPDIVCLQEFSTEIRTRLDERLSEIYQYQSFSTRWGDYRAVAVLSRYPITEQQVIKIATDISTDENDLLYVKLEINGRNVHLYNTHLYHGGNNIKRAVAGRDVSRSLRRAKNDYLRHRQEAKVLYEHVASKEGSVILAADFNDTPNSSIYHQFAAIYKNAFAAQGWGLGTTYGLWSLLDNAPEIWRFLLFDFLRIDHVFFSQDIVIHSARVGNCDASDHRPLLVTFSL